MEALSPDAGAFLPLSGKRRGCPAGPGNLPRSLPRDHSLHLSGWLQEGGVVRGKQHPPLRVSPRSQGVGRGGRQLRGQHCNLSRVPSAVSPQGGGERPGSPRVEVTGISCENPRSPVWETLSPPFMPDRPLEGDLQRGTSRSRNTGPPTPRAGEEQIHGAEPGLLGHVGQWG